MEELSGFAMQNSLTLLSLANNFFNILRDENGEPNYTYNDEWTRYFVPKRVTGGRCSALNQYYKSVISDEIFKIFSKQLGVNGNVCEIVDKYFEITTKHRKIIEDEYDSQFEEDETYKNSFSFCMSYMVFRQSITLKCEDVFLITCKSS